MKFNFKNFNKVRKLFDKGKIDKITPNDMYLAKKELRLASSKMMSINKKYKQLPPDGQLNLDI